MVLYVFHPSTINAYSPVAKQTEVKHLGLVLKVGDCNKTAGGVIYTPQHRGIYPTLDYKHKQEETQSKLWIIGKKHLHSHFSLPPACVRAYTVLLGLTTCVDVDCHKLF